MRRNRHQNMPNLFWAIISKLFIRNAIQADLLVLPDTTVDMSSIGSEGSHPLSITGLIVEAASRAIAREPGFDVGAEEEIVITRGEIYVGGVINRHLLRRQGGED